MTYEQTKKWRLNNPEKWKVIHKEGSRRFRKMNPESVKKSKEKWNTNHKEERYLLYKKWYKLHPTYHYKSHAEYMKKHPEYNVKIEHRTPERQKEVLEEADWWCR